MATKRPSRPPERVPSCPTLPPEIWTTIFRYHSDLAHLWNTCRRVSPTLRACAEYAFGEHFLATITIDFQLEKYNLGGKSKRPSVPATFDHLGKGREKGLAWFKDTRAKSEFCSGQGKKAQAEYERVMKRWEDNVNGWKPEMPNYTICVDGRVNDTKLPGLRIDVEAREVCFEWKETLRLFFRECERLHVLKDVWHAETAKKIRANNVRLAKGEKLMPSDYPVSWSAAEVEIRKEIRRARLKEHYVDDEEMVWAVDSLKHFENYGAAGGNAKVFTLNPDLPGAGLGEKWFGSINLVQELYLDEWSCMHRIDTQVEHIRNGR